MLDLAVIVVGQCESMIDTMLDAQGINPCFTFWLMNHHLGRRIAEKIINFALLIRTIEREKDSARLQAGEVQKQRVWRFFDLHGNAIARHYT